MKTIIAGPRFVKFTSVSNKPVYINKEEIALIAPTGWEPKDDKALAFIVLKGNPSAFSVMESVEQIYEMCQKGNCGQTS